jgi:hypothetical protein
MVEKRIPDPKAPGNTGLEITGVVLIYTTPEARGELLG